MSTTVKGPYRRSGEMTDRFSAPVVDDLETGKMQWQRPGLPQSTIDNGRKKRFFRNSDCGMANHDITSVCRIHPLQASLQKLSVVS